MDKPRGISNGDAMRWNEDVERRRRSYHERRCAEDPIYRRAYERQQEMMQRMQKMQSVAMAQLTNAMADEGDTKCRQATDQTAVGGEPQRMKTHEEVMRERSAYLKRMEQHRNAGAVGIGECALASGMMAMLFGGEEMKRRLQKLEEEKPYAEEIRKADKEFDSELIRMSGFEW